MSPKSLNQITAPLQGYVQNTIDIGGLGQDPLQVHIPDPDAKDDKAKEGIPEAHQQAIL